MTDSPKAAKVRQRKPKGPFSDELLDQILSELKGNDAESLLGQTYKAENEWVGSGGNRVVEKPNFFALCCVLNRATTV